MPIARCVRLTSAYIKKEIMGWRFLVAIVLYALILFMTTYSDFVLDGYGGVEYFLHYAFFNSQSRCFTSMICAMAASTTFCTEWISGYYIFTCSRVGRISYSLSVCASTAIVSFLVALSGMAIYAGIIISRYPLISENQNLLDSIVMSYTNGELIRQGNLFLYFLLFAFTQGAFASLFSVFAVLSSLAFPNPYLTVVAPMVIYTIITNVMSGFSVPRLLNPYYVFHVSNYVNAELGNLNVMGFNIIAGIYPLLYATSLIMLICLTVNWVLEKKYEKREV